MKKRVLIMALTLVVTISCVTVALFSCGDKDKKKEKVKEPESKYATDVGEFEYDENTDYTNQVYLFSGIVEYAQINEDATDGTHLAISLKSQNEKCKYLRGVGVLGLRNDEIGKLDKVLEKGKKVYVLCTSLTVPSDYIIPLYLNIEEDKYKIACSEAMVFVDGVDDISEIDKAYETERNKVETLTNKQYNLDEFINSLLDSTIECDRNLQYKGILNSEFLVDYEEHDFVTSKSVEFEKTYKVGSEEKKINIFISDECEADVNDMLENPKLYNIEFRAIHPYLEDLNKITISISELERC